MKLGFVFWLLMFLWLIFYLWGIFGTHPVPYVREVLFFVLFGILGWKAFGTPITRD